MTPALSATLHTDFADAVQRTRKALSEQGFGVLTEIDVTATMKQKLDADMEDYLILGACNPALAHTALGVDRRIGLLLPCNVVVRADRSDAGTMIVEAMNPEVLVQVAGDPALQEVADCATAMLSAAMAALG
ncbi:DUF302 domain-containing protein [Nocardia sp. NPDC004860]|uniref:DUF302 domain-containing protein n=1 Tax=Nocardia sp. NPDC004860 TaxID=3154557 RepID=UPI0033AEC3BC